MPTYSQDWFTAHIPIWTSVLSHLRDVPTKALEIGSFEGRSTVWLLENILLHKDSRIVCVDPYKSYSDLKNVDIDWDVIKQRFMDNTAPWKDKVELWQMDSKDLGKTDYNQYDFIYVDGGHESRQVFIDLALSHLLLKQGGIMIIDDYLWGGLAVGNNVPKGAIDAFMTAFSGDYELKSLGYQIILQKK